MKPTSIMIVENNSDYSSTLRHAFEDRGYVAWSCPAAEIAASILLAIHPNIVLLDLDLLGSNALDLIDAWTELAPNTRVIVEILVPDVHRLREALDHGAYAFLVKSHSLQPLFELLEYGQTSPRLNEQKFTQAAA